jgi:hypothetical protein
LLEELLRDRLPDDRVFEELDREVLLFDDAGGEDVRVAMVASVGECHTSPTLHTPGHPGRLAERPPRLAREKGGTR